MSYVCYVLLCHVMHVVHVLYVGVWSTYPVPTAGRWEASSAAWRIFCCFGPFGSQLIQGARCAVALLAVAGFMYRARTDLRLGIAARAWPWRLAPLTRFPVVLLLLLTSAAFGSSGWAGRGWRLRSRHRRGRAAGALVSGIGPGWGPSAPAGG
jgi:hypothetical protein